MSDTLSQYLPCGQLTALIRECLFVPQTDQDTLIFGNAIGMGLPQGSPLSPLLANLYLDVFDEQIVQQNFKLVRYADDFVILTQTQAQAENALQLTDTLLHALKLSLSEEKTQITSFDRGFDFLGHTFINDIVLDAKSYAPLLPQHHHEPAYEDSIEHEAYLSEPPTVCSPLISQTGVTIADADNAAFAQPATELNVKLAPRLKTLYITNQGAIVSKKGLRAQVRLATQTLASIPFGTLDAIVLLGRIHMTTDTMAHCMQHNISVVLASRSGMFKGIIDSYQGYSESLLRAQVAHTASVPRQHNVAQHILQAKINNSLVLLKRRIRKHPSRSLLQSDLDDFVDQVKRAKNRIKKENSPARLLGIEGNIAKGYFAIFKKLIAHHWQFSHRNRQPPKDPVNVMLSIGYTVLFNQLHTFCKL